jgi:phosphatidylserine decarboxylase
MEGGDPLLFYNLIKLNLMKKELKDKVYTLKGGSAPLCFMLASRHTRRYPLLHFDLETQTNRELRYARNQKSPFVDEQDDNAIVEPIVFEDGILTVQRHNVALQKFLDVHPANGTKFEERDLAVEAKEELEFLNLEVDALSMAKELQIDMVEMVCRVGLGKDTENISSEELRRDVLIYARNNPEEFLEILDNPKLKLQDFAKRLFNKGHLSTRNNGREIYYNLKNNKKRLLVVPFGEETLSALIAYFQSDEGLEAYELLQKKCKE